MDLESAKKRQMSWEEYLLMDGELFLKHARDFMLRKSKEADIVGIWKFASTFKPQDSLSEELKIVMVSTFIIVSAVFIGNYGLISIAHSEEGQRAVYSSKEDSIPDYRMEFEEQETDIKTINAHKLKSEERACQEDKDERRTSALCGKDDEEMIKKIEKERQLALQKQRLSSIKRTVRLSCGEGNYGHPSMSDTKGKHVDEDCCPDPDEWPKPGCVYDAKGYSIMLKGPRK